MNTEAESVFVADPGSDLVLGTGGTVCIATGNLAEPSETFVRNHIAHLFGGRTVVMSRRGTHPGIGKRPILYWKRRPLLLRAANVLDRPTWPAIRRLPGLGDDFPDAFREFALRHSVKFLLAEFGPIGIEFAATVRATGIPMFCYFRGYDASSKLRDRRYAAGLRKMMPLIDGVVAVSPFLLGRLAEEGITHDRSLVIPSGVDTSVFAPGPKDSGLILSVGRLVEKKNPLATISAFSRVSRDFPGARLEIIGGGPMLAACRAAIERLGLNGRVLMHGERPHRFIAEKMAAARVFALHSVTPPNGNTEGAPTVIQEAMASGSAVLSTRHAGIPGLVVHGQTGLLVAEGDVDDFSRQMHALLRDDAMSAELGARARRYAIEHLDLHMLLRRLEGAISEVIVAA